MASIVTELPLYSEPYFEYAINLEDVTRTLTFRWQDRNSSWYLDVRQGDDEYIVKGVRLVQDFPILYEYVLDEKDMSGYFCLIDAGDYSSGKLADDYTSLAKFYRLFYIYTESE